MVGKTKAMWLSVAITVLAASGGAAQQVEVMPDLSNPGVRQNFVSRLQERCGKGFAIEEIAAATDAQRGAFVCQTPPIGTPIGCKARVRVYVANGMPRTPPDNEETGAHTPQPCEEAIIDGLNKPHSPTPQPPAPTIPEAPPVDPGAEPT